MTSIRSRLWRWTALVGLAALLFASLPAAAGAGGPAPGTARIALADVSQPVRLMVELTGAPLADDLPGLGLSLSATARQVGLKAEHDGFRSALHSAGIAYKQVGEYTKLFNGLALQVANKDAGRIAGLKGVKAVFVSRHTDLPKPMLASSTKMIGADKAWAGDPARRIPGVDGTGITVAVIDTGIDYTHPDLGGCLGPNCRVVYGYDFVGNDFDGTNDPHPGPDPMDKNGHGTHVAGIIGAKAAGPDGVTGVAPGVKFVALKVFGPTGSTWDDIVLQAMEAAYDLKVDVVNMSLGAAFQWPEYPTAQATQRLAQKGIFVATAAGNEGESGEYAVGAPAVGSGTIAVASFENDILRTTAFLDPTGAPMAYGVMEFSPKPPSSGKSADLVYVGLGQDASDFTNPDGSSKVQGKVALISRGAISFAQKSRNAQHYGAVQAIVFNNQAGTFSGTLGAPGDYIPTLSLTRADGQKLVAALQNGPVQVTWTNKFYAFPNPTAGLLSGFSSYGPAPDLTLKPDVTAPGGSIFSTYPVSMGSYATLSGTSMASPHVAGAAALLLQANRGRSPIGGGKVKAQAIGTILMNTAQPKAMGAGSTKLYPTYRQGAGMIDVWRAVTATQRVTPEKLSLGVVKPGAVLTQAIMIENLGTKAETYSIGVTAAADDLPLTVAAQTLTVPAGMPGRLSMNLTVARGMPQGLFSGWLTVTSSAGEIVARVPYVGYNGDYQAASALDPLAYGLPWLASLQDGYLYYEDAMTIRPTCGCDAATAWLLFSLARQPQELRIEIWNARTGRKAGDAFVGDYLGRSAGAIETYQWDGTTSKGQRVPAGDYVLRLMVLRPLGDPNNPAHWDVWTTGPITVNWN